MTVLPDAHVHALLTEITDQLCLGTPSHPSPQMYGKQKYWISFSLNGIP